MDGHLLAGSGAKAGLSSRNEDEAQLVERAKRDPRAFAQIYTQLYEPVGRYLYRRTGDGHATEDLLAETFLTLLRRLPTYRWRGIPLRYWVFRVATHAANRWARKRQHRTFLSLSLDLAPVAPVDSGDSWPDLEPVERALLALSPDHQAVLVLHHVEELSVEDVAVILGCRVGTVKSRLARAREAMRDQLRNCR